MMLLLHLNNELSPTKHDSVSVRTYPTSYQWQRAIAVRASRAATPRHNWDRPHTRCLPSGRRVKADVCVTGVERVHHGDRPSTCRSISQSQQAMRSRSKRCGFCPPDLPDFDQLLQEADDRLFERILQKCKSRTTHYTSYCHHNLQHHRTIISDNAIMTDNCMNIRDT